LSLEDFFGPPISTYTDEQAVEDGVLVDISRMGLRLAGKPVNRMTAHFYGALSEFTNEALPGLPTMAQILRTKLKFATQGEPSDGYLFVLPGGGGDAIWAVRNELGGYTVMFASDY